MGAWSFEELLEHAGHKIECVIYGDIDDPTNVAVECVDCYCVLIDQDCPDEGDKDAQDLFDKLLSHVYHEIKCNTTRGDDDAVIRVSLECVECGDVLLSFCNPMFDKEAKQS